MTTGSRRGGKITSLSGRMLENGVRTYLSVLSVKNQRHLDSVVGERFTNSAQGPSVQGQEDRHFRQ